MCSPYTPEMLDGARGNSECDFQGGRREADVELSGHRPLGGRARDCLYRRQEDRRYVGLPAWSRRAGVEHGAGQFVPVAGAGSQVRVRSAKGTLIASGRYHREID